jgi:hypothetical protein
LGFDAGDANVTRYVGNSPLTHVDPDGLRTVTIEIVYYLEELKITPGVQKEVERVFQDIITRYAPKDKNGKPCHTLKFKWTVAKTKANYDKTKFGYSGGNVIGWYPTGITLGVRDSLKLDVPGQSSDFKANLNPKRLFDAATGKDRDLALATVIAHELGLHALGGKIDHFTDTGYIDSSIGQTGGKFCDDAAKLIADRMDVDVK